MDPTTSPDILSSQSDSLRVAPCKRLSTDSKSYGLKDISSCCMVLFLNNPSKKGEKKEVEIIFDFIWQFTAGEMHQRNQI